MTSRSVSPSMFHGLPWETWTNVLGRTSPQDDEDEVRGQQILKPTPISTVMKLPKEDMWLFGVCPKREAFSVVVCEVCLLSITPQGLLNHMELRHKKPQQPAAASPPTLVEKIPNKLVKPMKFSPTKIKLKKSIVKDITAKKTVDSGVANSNVTPLRIPMVLTAETALTPATKELNPPNSKEDLLQPVVALTPISGPVSPSATPPVLTKPSAPHLVNPPSALPVLSSSAKAPKHPRPDRKCVPIKEREYDPDKHCGVAVNPSGEPTKPCTRSLTCKSHSMSLRRAVTGRSKSFDQLLAEHRQAKEAIIRQKKLLETQTTSLASKNPVSQSNQDKDKQKDKEHPTLLVTSANGTTTVIGGTFRAVRGNITSTEGVPQEVTIHMPISVSLLSPVSIPSLGLPDLTIDVTTEKPARLSSTPKSFIFKHQVLERISSFSMVGPRKVQSLELPLNSSHPKSLSVCTFSSHKIGGLVYTNRRMQIARQGLEGALHRGAGNLGNGIYARELYATMPMTGHSTSAISNVLNNVSSKALYQRTKGVTRTKNSDKPSKKIALMGLPKQGTSILNVPLSLKSVVPKPYSVPQNRTTLPQSTPTSSLTVKNNGQFHIPNILGGALKRSVDSGTTPSTQQLNTAQIIGSLLSNHTKNGLPQNKNNMPLVRVAITNGLVDGDSKAIYSTSLIGELSKAADNTNSNITVNQNVRLTAAQNANHVVPQITYLTTAPVTFQQLPVLSSQQKYPGLSSAN